MTLHHTPDSDLEVAQLIGAAGARPVPDADRTARVRDAVAREWRAQARARRMRRLTAAGMALLAAAAAVFLAVRPGSTPAPIATVAAAHGDATMEIASGRAAAVVVGQTIAAGSSIRTNDGSRATVTLPDGGEVRIDAKTVATFVDAHTIDLERGAIYIDSGASTPGRFTVRTASGTVRDIGTRFEVRVGDRDLRVPMTIKVRDGAVQLERAGRIDRAPEGTELLARADGTVSTKSLDPFAADWAWTTAAAPTFIAENATLEAFLEWAAREGGWTIEWSDALRQRARTTILHGPIDGLAPADALDVVLPTCGLSPEFVHGRLRLRPVR
jgi:ferric-dicitrate binding protein FerR (iron transport regulator)